MAKLIFHDFRFEEEDEIIKADFLKIFSLKINKADLKKIGLYIISKEYIDFPQVSEHRAKKLFLQVLEKSFSNLINKITKNPVLYIHKNSGIPLIGSLGFGIVDKGTDMLELKPITSCNMDCIFCSVDEGLSTKKSLDIVIEKDYLVEETKKLLEYKDADVNIYINPHGEPLLYADIVELVRDLSNIKQVKGISVITNATLLTNSLAKELIEAGVTAFNVSLHSLNSEKARHLFHSKGYNINKVKKILTQIKNKVKLIITPVLINGFNNEDIEEIIEWCKKENFECSIQNFLYNKRGRNPTRQLEFKQFYAVLRNLEKKYNVKLIFSKKISHTKELPLPFKKGDLIQAEVLSRGRYHNECLAVAKNRVITLKCPFESRRSKKIKITRSKHNIFTAIPA